MSTALKPTGSFSLSWGVVVIPVQYYTATSPKDLSFNTLCPTCDPAQKLQQQYVCPGCSSVVEYKDRRRGYEYEKGQYVLISDDDLAAIPLPSRTNLTIDAFAPASTLDPLAIEKTYYLGPKAGAERALALLVHGMQSSDQIAIGKVALRQKEQLCCLRWSPRHQNLQLHQLFFDAEVRQYAEAPLPVPLSEEEIQMAEMLIKLKSKPVDLATYNNDYQAALQALIAQKLQDPTRQFTAPAPAAAPDLGNLAELLRQSIQLAA